MGAYKIAMGIGTAYTWAYVVAKKAFSKVTNVFSIAKETMALVKHKIGLGLTTAGTWALTIAKRAFTKVLNSFSMAKETLALVRHKIALGLTTVGTWAAAAAQTAFAAALNLGLFPILLIVGAIAGLIAIIYNWDKVTAWFGKQWEKFTNWIGDLWSRLVGWFSGFDFLDFFKKIGQGIAKYMLFPITALLHLVSKIPGKIGDMASLGLSKIGELTGEIEVNNQNSVEQKPLSSPELNTARITKENIQRNTLVVEINDNNNNVKSTEMQGELDIPVLLTPTF